MSATLIAAQAGTGPNPSAGLALTWTAADVANGNYTPSTGREILLVNNTDVSARHVTITSQVDGLGRTKDITSEAIAAGGTHAFGPVQRLGWADNSGNLNFSADNAAVKFAIVQI